MAGGVLCATVLPSVNHYLQRHNLSHAQFAALIGVSSTHASKMIAGDRAMSVKVLRKIHEVTKIDVKKLLYECT